MVKRKLKQHSETVIKKGFSIINYTCYPIDVDAETDLKTIFKVKIRRVHTND